MRHGIGKVGLGVGLQARPRFDPSNPRFLLATLALVVVLLLGYLALVWILRWRQRMARGGDGDRDDLARYQELYDRGELSQQEYERIRAALGRRPSPPGAAPPAQPDEHLRPGPPGGLGPG